MQDVRSTGRAALFLSLFLWFFSGDFSWPISPHCDCPADVSPWHGRWVAVYCGAGEGAIIQGPTRLLFSLPVALRQTDAHTLTFLPGLGEKRSEAVIRFRESGRLRQVKDLLKIHGIGKKTLEKLRPLVVIDYPERCEQVETAQ